MPFIEVDLRISGTSISRLGFGQTGALNINWRPVMAKLAAAYQAYEERVFTTEGAAGLGRWRPLSPAYARWKAVHFPGRPILTRTGALRTAAKQVLAQTDTRLVMGPGHRVPYAIFHEMGTRKMPARPFVRPSPPMIQQFREIAREAIVSVRRFMKEQ